MACRGEARGAHIGPLSSTPLRGLPLALRRAWAGWLWVARHLVEFQSRVLLAVLYALLVIPVGLLLRLLADPLGQRRRHPTNWTPRAAAPPTLEEARRQ